MYCCWRPGDVDREAWSTGLRAVGATLAAQPGVGTVQVNVDDADVAPALVRITSFDEPVAAIVAVWVDTATGTIGATVEAELGSTCARLAGYLVTESVPLVPSPSPPGARTPGFANMALLRRPDDLDPATWLHRWQGEHTRIAVDLQSTMGYVQNVVVRPVTPDAPPIDGIVEELFPAEAMADLHVFFDTGRDDAELGRRMTAMTDSVANFSGPDAVLDVVPTSRFVL